MTPFIVLGIIIALLFPVGLACYAFGWYWRGKHDTLRHIKYEDLTPAQQKRFDALFDRFDKVMDQASSLFDNPKG